MNTTHIHHRQQCDPPGECIYCGKNSELSEEHVVPFALGGNMVIPAGSCAECAKITSRFERSVLRGFMYPARIVGRFPTRRPKKRPTELPLRVLRGDDATDESLPIAEHPGILVLPLLSPPHEIYGGPTPTGASVVGLETLVFGKNVVDIIRDREATGIQGQTDLDVTAFGRLLAKIAYGFAVFELGMLDRRHVPILPIILGQSDKISKWVGSVPFTHAVDTAGPLHSLSLQFKPDDDGSGYGRLVARVRLFATSGCTGYEVLISSHYKHAA